MNGLVRDLAAAMPRLTSRVLDEMYADPFWQERFGERGRAHAAADGAYHVRYLIAALEGDEPDLFVSYARWLRDVLVARGMCSYHLFDNLVRLAGAIGDEEWPDRQRAVAILEAGAAGLAYADGPAAAVDALGAAVARTAASAGRYAGPDANRRQHLLSYLADALACGIDVFGPFVSFLRATARARGTRAVALDAELAALTELPGLPAAARELVERARQKGTSESRRP